MSNQLLNASPLGKKSKLHTVCDPTILFAIKRSLMREKLTNFVPYFNDGSDFWRMYEFSWLNLQGKPQIAILELEFPASSPSIVESKSLKLYLNAFLLTKFATANEVKAKIFQDLSAVTNCEVNISLLDATQNNNCTPPLQGISLDTIETTITAYNKDETLLRTSNKTISETLYSHLFQSCCPVTGYPDFGTISINYSGPKIDRESLLHYLISFKKHSGFAELCVEEIYLDLFSTCQPEKLSVYGIFTRRGGIDINVFRSNFEKLRSNIRLTRQ